MPLGDVPVGADPLGVEPAPYEPEDKPTMPRMVFFDGTTRDFPLDDDGRYVDIHPVDHAVQFAMFLEFGRVASALEAGNTLRSVGSPIGAGVALEIDSRVRTALRSLVQRRLISVSRIEHQAPNRHTLFVALTYVNLQTAREDTVYVPAP